MQTTEFKQPDCRSTGAARAWGREHVEGAFAGLGTHLGRATACPRFLPLCWGPMWCSHKLRPRLLTPDSGHEMHLMKFHFCFSAPPRLFCPLKRKEGLKLKGQFDPTTDLATPAEEQGQRDGANGAEDETAISSAGWSPHSPALASGIPSIGHLVSKSRSTCLLSE